MLTFIATFELVFVSFPNCPYVLFPQLYTSPSFVRASMCDSPADIFTILLKLFPSAVFTCPNTAVLPPVVPCPNSSLSFVPVVQTVPSDFRTTV